MKTTLFSFSLATLLTAVLWDVLLVSNSVSQTVSGLTPTSSRPNIILINLDDADRQMFELSYSGILFPNIMKIASDGVRFKNFHVTTPLCGPSRACLYRGQYAHNTGIKVNIPRVPESHNFDGGFQYYRSQGYFENDLSTWMKGAGYRTMMVGKFLHSDFQPYVPRGWDDFYFYLGGLYFGTYRFTNRTLPQGKTDRIGEGEYRTTAETQDAVRLMQEHVARNSSQPFFLNLNPLGPHKQQSGASSMIPKHYESWWTAAQQTYSAAYDEVNFSDKRGHFRPLKRLTAEGHFLMREHYRERLLATRAVDDMVARVRQTLTELGIANNTYIFVTSDNGFSLGHHRSTGKGTPTDRSSHVPLFVLGPDVQPGQVSDQLLGHIDLAPTIVELAGGITPSFVDGRSFANVIKHRGSDVLPPIRDALLIENWANQFQFGTESSAASTSLRYANSVYTEWSNGDRDFYDLVDDPQQLKNGYDALAPNEKLFLELTLRTMRNPQNAPQARFSNPIALQQVLPKNAILGGMAEDSIGVHQVRLAIRDLSTNCFWDGQKWQTGFLQVSAELKNPGGQITEWYYPQMPTGANLPAGKVVCWAWATDSRFRYSAPAVARFEFDRSGPELSLISPQAGQRFALDAFIFGTVSDQVGVNEVRVQLRDLNTNLFWNGNVQVFQSSIFDNVVRPRRVNQWEMLVPLPQGSYDVRALAVDTSGNLSAPVGANFFVD